MTLQANVSLALTDPVCASSYPYTYTDLERYLHSIDKMNLRFYKREVGARETPLSFLSFAPLVQSAQYITWHPGPPARVGRGFEDESPARSRAPQFRV